MIKLFISYVIFTAGLRVLCEVLFIKYPILRIDDFNAMFACLAVVTLLAGGFSLVGVFKSAAEGTMIMLAALAVKMLCSMAFVLFYVMKHKHAGTVFGLEFFILYILFTCFEMYALLVNLRHQINHKKTPINEH